MVVKGTPRLLVSGSPMAIPNWKIHAVAENSGAVIVGEESCVGERNFGTLVDQEFRTLEEGLDAIAARYLSINCACFTPNDARVDDVARMTERLHADGVIHYALQFCTPYLVEAFRVEKHVEAKKIPFLDIETDYSMGDMGQLKTRIEAFVEMIVTGRAR